MPQITIEIAQGRTPEQIRTLMGEVHAAVLRTVSTKAEHIRVVVHEVPRTHWATGDVTIAEMDAARAAPAAVPQNDSAADERLRTIEDQEQQ